MSNKNLVRQREISEAETNKLIATTEATTRQLIHNLDLAKQGIELGKAISNAQQNTTDRLTDELFDSVVDFEETTAKKPTVREEKQLLNLMLKEYKEKVWSEYKRRHKR